MIRCITICLAAFLAARPVSAQVSFTPPGTNPALQRTETGPSTAAPAQPAPTPQTAPASPPPSAPVAPPRSNPVPAVRSPQVAPQTQPTTPRTQPQTQEPKKALEAKKSPVHFAIAPSRLEFTAAGKNKVQPLTIRAWSENKAIAYAAGAFAPWVQVTPVKRNANDPAQKFTVTVDPAGLQPGKHEGQIEISTPDAGDAPIRVPVVLNIAAGSGSTQEGAAPKMPPGAAPPKQN